MKKPLIFLAILMTSVGVILSVRSLLKMPAIGSSEVMSVMFRIGGLCSDGVCKSEIRRTVYSDGTYTGRGKISTTNMKLLRARIADLENDPRELSENPICESYADGSDMVWIFPAIGTIIPCEIETAENKKIIDDIKAILASAS